MLQSLREKLSLLSKKKIICNEDHLPQSFVKRSV